VEAKSSSELGKSCTKAFEVFASPKKSFNEIYRKLQSQLVLVVVCILNAALKPVANAKLINCSFIAVTRRETFN
jgi:hypothetical protein